MSTRHTKIRRDLRRNWGRAVLAVLSITIGVLAVGINSVMMDLMPASNNQATTELGSGIVAPVRVKLRHEAFP